MVQGSVSTPTRLTDLHNTPIMYEVNETDRGANMQKSFAGKYYSNHKGSPSWNKAFPLPSRQCEQCGGEIPSKRKGGIKVKYCSRQCYLKSQSDQYRAQNAARSPLPTGTIGAIGELKVSADLLMKGFEVFRALSPSCSCDLAVLRDNELKRIEVRTGHYDAKGKPYKVVVTEKHRADILAIILPDKIIYKPPFTKIDEVNKEHGETS